MSNVCFVDTETTGLHPDKHQLWEVALITPNGREHVWQFPVDELAADPFALIVGHWWDRAWANRSDISDLDAIYEAHNEKSRGKFSPHDGRLIKPAREWCEHFRNLVGEAHIVGAVPSFDEERLRRLLERNGVLHRWHYHIVDVEALIAGQCRIPPPWDSTELSRAVGVEPDDFDRHTALGDARWAKALYEAVFRSDA